MADSFIIATSRVSTAEGVSTEHVRRLVRDLEEAHEIEVQRTPTGRSYLTIAGYRRVSEAIHGGRRAA